MRLLLLLPLFFIACDQNKPHEQDKKAEPAPTPPEFELIMESVDLRRTYHRQKAYLEVRSKGSMKNASGFNLTDYSIKIRVQFHLENETVVAGFDVRGPMRFNSDNGFGQSLFGQKAKWKNSESKQFQIVTPLIKTGIIDYPVKRVFVSYQFEAKDLLDYNFKDEVHIEDITDQWVEMIN